MATTTRKQRDRIAFLESCQSMAYVYFEFHKNLQVATVSLRITSSSTNCVEITLTKQEIIFTFFNENANIPSTTHVRFQAEGGLAFLPASLSGLTGLISRSGSAKQECIYRIIPNTISEVSFRVQLNEMDDHRSNELGATSNKVLPVSVDSYVKYELTCVSCQKQLGKELTFSRSVQLPDEGWEEMAGEWFCHQHDENIKQCPLAAESSCLYTDSSHFLLSQKCFEVCNLFTENDKRLLCPRCLLKIGDIRQLHFIDPRAKFFAFCQHKVAFEPPVKKLNYEPLNIIAEVILKQPESVLICKLCVQNQVSDVCLLLWVMDKNHRRFFTPVNVSSSQTIPIEARSFIKVLYLVSSRKDALCICWQKDPCVEDLQLQEDCFWNVLNALIQSTETTPLNHRMVDGFLVGYIDGAVK